MAPPLWPGLLLAMAGAIAFSGKAIIVKLAYRHGVDAVTLIMLRMLFALPLFVGLAWWAGRGRPRLTGRDWRVVAGLGFSGYYLASFLDFAGLAYVSAGFERLVLYLNPTLVRMLDYKQNPQAACDAPRWRFNLQKRLNLEGGVPADTVQGLKSLGHALDEINDSYQDFGAGQFIWRLGDPAVEGYAAASDPRRDGLAAGF